MKQGAPILYEPSQCVFFRTVYSLKYGIIKSINRRYTKDKTTTLYEIESINDEGDTCIYNVEQKHIKLDIENCTAIVRDMETYNKYYHARI